MESVKKTFSSIAPSSLFVIGNIGLTGILYGLEYLVDWNSPCPCDPEWNTAYTALTFLVPVLLLLFLSLFVLPNSRLLLKCGMCIPRPGEGEQKDSTDSSCTACMDTLRKCATNILLTISSRIFRCGCMKALRKRAKYIPLPNSNGTSICDWNSTHGSCCDCMKTHTCSKYFLLNTLMQICIPPMIWIVILLLDGDYVACSYATAINRTQGDLCQHLCSLQASSYLLSKCYRSRISGGIVLGLSVFILVLLKFGPTWIGSKCTQGDYYKVKYERLLEKNKLIKMKEELRNRVEKDASKKAKEFISQLKLGNMSEQGEQQSNETTDENADEVGQSETSL